jgi:hypothetical protein
VKLAIVLSTFYLVNFVKLNLFRLRELYRGCPVLVSDDRSSNSDEIKKLAEDFGCSHICSSVKRGHFAGDIQSIISGLSFAEQEGAEILMKLSQRLVPVLPVFRDYIETPFADDRINIVVPGKISANQINYPNSKFLSGMGILTDVIAIRVGSITPEQLRQKYVANFKYGRFSSNLLVEVFFGELLATHFAGASFVSPALANHKPFEPCVFLRKATNDPRAYAMVAKMHGLEGLEFDTRECGEIFKTEYLSRPCLTQ